MDDYLKWLTDRQRIAEARIAAMTAEDHERIADGNALMRHTKAKGSRPTPGSKEKS
jgi:hypothetical protein